MVTWGARFPQAQYFLKLNYLMDLIIAKELLKKQDRYSIITENEFARAEGTAPDISTIKKMER